MELLTLNYVTLVYVIGTVVSSVIKVGGGNEGLNQ